MGRQSGHPCPQQRRHFPKVTATIPTRAPVGALLRAGKPAVRTLLSGEQPSHDLTFDVGQTKIPALEAVSQLGVIESEQVEQRRL